jgi:hypothetical protein
MHRSDDAGRRTWSVWSNQVEHRVDLHLNVLTGGLRLDVDGVETLKRSGWKMGMNGAEIPFDVDGRPCLLVVRAHYGAAPEVDLYSDGRSLATGEPLADRREQHGREIPNVIRVFLVLLPAVAVPSALRGSSSAGSRASTVEWVILVGAGLVVAGIGWWAARRWYAGGPERPNRHLVGAGIVAAAYAAFFAVIVVVFLVRGSA